MPQDRESTSTPADQTPSDRTPADRPQEAPGKARVILPRPPPQGGAAPHGPAGGPPRKDGRHSQTPRGKPGRVPGRNG